MHCMGCHAAPAPTKCRRHPLASQAVSPGTGCNRSRQMCWTAHSLQWCSLQGMHPPGAAGGQSPSAGWPHCTCCRQTPRHLEAWTGEAAAAAAAHCATGYDMSFSQSLQHLVTLTGGSHQTAAARLLPGSKHMLHLCWIVRGTLPLRAESPAALLQLKATGLPSAASHARTHTHQRDQNSTQRNGTAA